jgi:VanZ family protein
LYQAWNCQVHQDHSHQKNQCSDAPFPIWFYKAKKFSDVFHVLWVGDILIIHLYDNLEPKALCEAYLSSLIKMLFCGSIVFMFKLTQILPRWLPAIVIMLVIFVFSSQPSVNLPNFDWADSIVKKGGHVLGYSLLAFSYWYALPWTGRKRWLAWMLTILYACTDEFHQSFVAGRHSSIWDIMIFDNMGALISLWLVGMCGKQKRSGMISPGRSND